jgi:hypothetical protein
MVAKRDGKANAPARKPAKLRSALLMPNKKEREMRKRIPCGMAPVLAAALLICAGCKPAAATLADPSPILCPMDAKYFASFSFLDPAATGTIDQANHIILVMLPLGTPLEALAASFTIMGNAVSVNGLAQSSGTSIQDFSLPVAYTITAKDGSDASYTVIARDGISGQRAYIKASNAQEQDNFACAVSLSGDTLAVGAFTEASGAKGVNGDQNDNSAPCSGAVYVFKKSGSTWSQQAYIKASNAEEGDCFGSSVSLSGDTLAVGAPGEDSSAKGLNQDQSDNGASGSGAAYVFTRSASSWSQRAYIKASNTGMYDDFGRSVTLAGECLAVGAPGEASSAKGVNQDQTDDEASWSGAVYVFTGSESDWTQQAYIKASNTGMSDRFGSCASLSGDSLAIGAPSESSLAIGVNHDQSNDDSQSSGAIYVFTRSASTWTQQAYIKASNTGKLDSFGNSVSLSGDSLAVGAYYEGSDALGIDGDQMNDAAESSGAVYVFTRQATVWSQQAYLKASNTKRGTFFGMDVALSGDSLIVGSHQENSGARGIDGNQSDMSCNASGAVYAFTRRNGFWAQKNYIKPAFTQYSDFFGYCVSLSGSTIAVGAVYESSGATGVDGDQEDQSAYGSGAAFIFQ